MKIYIKEHFYCAGKWIYSGYKAAWEKIGFDAKYYTNIGEINDSDYFLMAVDADITKPSTLSVVKKAKKAFIYAGANTFPKPWGTHPNFRCICDNKTIERLNAMDNVYLWSFGDAPKEFVFKWKKVNPLPLAFDSINYKNLKEDSYKFDVCYIGGWANNGFNEKQKIMIEHFSLLKGSGLKCGIFINKDLTQEQENFVLCNSKVSLNIHDAYQRVLGFDSNERTFKSLGLTGALVCDKVTQVKNIFPHLELYESPQQMLEMIKELVNKPPKELEELKNENRQIILKNHTYINRVEQLRSFV